MRSLTLDVTSWTDEMVETMKNIGNVTSNSIWDPRPDAVFMRKTVSRAAYIRDKYAFRLFVRSSGLQSPTEILQQGLEQFDFLKVLKGIALRVRLNDLSVFPRPLLFQALGYKPLSSEVEDWYWDKFEKERFLVVELLLQNGLDINSLEEKIVALSSTSHQFGFMTPLLYACLLNDNDAIIYLLRKGANPAYKVVFDFLKMGMRSKLSKIGYTWKGYY